jgi:hypothetical protein
VNPYMFEGVFGVSSAPAVSVSVFVGLSLHASNETVKTVMKIFLI